MLLSHPAKIVPGMEIKIYSDWDKTYCQYLRYLLKLGIYEHIENIITETGFCAVERLAEVIRIHDSTDNNTFNTGIDVPFLFWVPAN